MLVPLINWWLDPIINRLIGLSYYTMSHHPRQLINNLPYGQFLRLKSNSSSEIDYKCEEAHLCEQLRAQGYLSNIIDKAKLRARHKPHHPLLTESNRSIENRLTFGIDFIPLAYPIKSIILKKLACNPTYPWMS